MSVIRGSIPFSESTVSGDELCFLTLKTPPLSLWLGFGPHAWFRALIRNRFRVGPRKIPLAFAITIATIYHALLRPLERVIYGSRIRKAVVDPHPLFIIGHWRCGTTFLHELLCADPRHSYATTYECLNPCHFLLTERLATPILKRIVPHTRLIDAARAGIDRPQEDEFALCMQDAPSPYLGFAFPTDQPLYTEYLYPERLSPGEMGRWERVFMDFLKRVLLRRPGRLILKSPVHTFRIRKLLELFPDARFVHIVRNPYEVVPSMMRSLGMLPAAFALQKSDPAAISKGAMDLMSLLYSRFHETRGLIPSGQLYEIRYENLVADPHSEMKKLYGGLGLGGFEEALPAIDQYLTSVKDHRVASYEFTPELISKIRQEFGDVIDHYGYTAPA